MACSGRKWYAHYGPKWLRDAQMSYHVWPAVNSNLPKKNRIRFQGNGVKEIVCEKPALSVGRISLSFGIQ
jgi:hypothetical protein